MTSLNTATDRINLAFIASIGRSGTTLLDCMLGAHSEVASVGELHIWPHELREGGRLPTGSGHLVQEDPFWVEMRRRVDPLLQPAPRLDHFRELHNAGRTLRPSRVSDFGFKDLAPDLAAAVHQYALNNLEIYSHFLDLVEEHTGSRPLWIADSSKDPYRLCWLVRSGLFNVRLIHVVKNPSAFIYSVTKPHIFAPEYAVHRRLYWTFRQSGAWSVRNHLIRQVARYHLSPDASLLLQYESLAAEPEAAMHAICDLVGLPYEEKMVHNFREGSPFAIAGNPMRQGTGGIRLDEVWKQQLPASSHLLTRMITSVNRSTFGYE